MKAVIVDRFGPPADLRIGELPSPALRPNSVRLRIRAASINFADVLMIQGLYQEKPPFPFSPGLEVAGELIEVAPQIDHLKVGMRVAALVGHGGFAEEVVADAATVVPIPDAMDYETAAAFTVVYGTAQVALERRARLQPGEVLLVHGAAGGVGLAAVEIGNLMGATVIATASTAEKLALAQRYGADHLINYTEQDFRAVVKQVTAKRGADVIFDPVGGDVFDESLRCIAWEGRLIVIGFAGGRIPKAPANLLLVKNCSVVGLYWGAYAQRNPPVLVDSLKTLYQWYTAGKLRPHISAVYPMEDVAEAMQSLIDRRATGKVVIKIDGAD